ncbi:MAG: OmpA family protein [Myxococcales bacterium]|nr:OmpA family protein [Myxococcales bacterium]
MTVRTSIVGVLVAGCAALFDATANAQSSALHRFFLVGEVGAGSMLSEWQRSTAGYGLAVEGAGRLGFTLIGPLGAQVGGGSRVFPRSGNTAGQLWTAGGGLRADPLVHRLVRLAFDANANVAFTAEKTRFSWDLSAGAQIQVHPAVGVGAYARFGYLHAASSDLPDNAAWLTGGLSLTLRLPERSADDAESDTDSDGVVDSEDFCPLEPMGSSADADRPGCPRPRLDRDNDGVIDREDFCESVPAGRSPDPTRRGCPLTVSDEDTDGDGIADRLDACPRERGVASRNPRRRGCPRTFQFEVEGADDWVTDPVFFERGDPTVSPRSRSTLDTVREALELMPMLRVVSIEGHADDTGTPQRNEELSLQRAQNVYDWLVAHGINASRLRVRGRGSDHPMIPGTSARARSVNRRVEFLILEVDDNAPSLTTRSVTQVPEMPADARRPEPPRPRRRRPRNE